MSEQPEPSIEQIVQRRTKFAKKFVEQGATVPKAVQLSGVAEKTAQRRGRPYDPLTAIMPQPQPQPQPQPKPQPAQAPVLQQVAGLACFPIQRKVALPKGVLFSALGCPVGQVAVTDYSESRNFATEKYFATQIVQNRKALQNAGIILPPTTAEKQSAQRQVNKLQQSYLKACRAPYNTSTSCRSLSRQLEALKKQYKGFF